VADAGPSRYAASEPIRLDGTGSYDPDGGPILGFEWRQVSGPTVTISDADTATPGISDFPREVFIQTVEFELVVNDDTAASRADTVEVVIVPRMTHRTMHLLNPPFRQNLPTLITFGGGNCVDGGELRPDGIWRERFNIVTGRYFFPYADHAYQIMVLLSSLAPDYRRPIQTIGFSTGGNPASRIAIIINQYFHDPRYAVNRMTLLDTYCDDELDLTVAEFNRHRVADEPAWAEVYRSAPEPIPGALNVSFFPGGDHNTPPNWFFGSAGPESWPDGDMYNQGVTAGYFVSVGGPARNLQIATDDLTYFFECPEVEANCLRQTDAALHPGLIPEPVGLVGPADGARVWSGGVMLSCEESLHATSYELLFGRDPSEMTMVVAESSDPPRFTVDDLPFTPTYWTVRARDAFGSTISAPPRALFASDAAPVRRPLRRTIPNP
jgi:hypothetical protein